MPTDKLKAIVAQKSARNISCLGGVELIQKVLRIATVIILTRIFSPSDYGSMCAVYTVFELVNSFTLQTEISQKIICAKHNEIATVANTAYWLSCIVCCSLFVLQWIAADAIALFYHSDRLSLPLRILGLVYLMSPLYLVQSALIERENKLQIKAWCFAIQAIASNLILLVLAILGWRVWAVVWSIVLSYPLWIIIYYRNHSWRSPEYFSLKGWREIIDLDLKVLGFNFSDKLRQHLDYLIIARFLGIEALGIYFFAFSLGLGLIQSMINGLSLIWYANYCQVNTSLKKLKVRYFNSFKIIALLVLPISILQASLTYFWFPIILGNRWIGAIPLLITIGFIAIPIAMQYSISRLLCAIDKLEVDLFINLLLITAMAFCLPFAAHQGIIWVARTVLIIQSILIPIMAIAIARYTLRYKPSSSY